MILKLEIDRETYERLARAAETEHRPVSMQAEVILRRAVGLPAARQDAGRQLRHLELVRGS